MLWLTTNGTSTTKIPCDDGFSSHNRHNFHHWLIAYSFDHVVSWYHRATQGDNRSIQRQAAYFVKKTVAGRSFHQHRQSAAGRFYLHQLGNLIKRLKDTLRCCWKILPPTSGSVADWVSLHLLDDPYGCPIRNWLLSGFFRPLCWFDISWSFEIPNGISERCP